MTPERIYTLPELAEKTGRPYEFWDTECREGRLRYLQPRGRGTTRAVSETQYAEWFSASIGEAPKEREPVASAIGRPRLRRSDYPV